MLTSISLKPAQSILKRFVCGFAPKQSRIIYKEFANRTMVVTGASDGIGKGIAERLNEQNTTVIAIGRNKDKLKDLPNNCNTISADLSKPSNIDAIIKDIKSAKPEFLINCAGISIAKDGRDKFMNLDYDGLRQVHGVNFESVFYLSQQLCRYWIDSKIEGRIVNVSSAASIKTLSEHVAYTTSKYASDALTKTMALELGKYNIRCNSIHPTVVLTPMAKRIWFEDDGITPTQAAKDQLLKDIPMGRFLEVDEVVDLIFFLLSDSAMMITAQLISIDGGLTC